MLGWVFPMTHPGVNAQAPDGMVLLPAGEYAALYRSLDEPDTIQVDAFYLDITPVTNADFLAFVTAKPKWRRSMVSPLFASEGYLRHWASDTSLGAAPLDAPVINVSWFAAQAYARWQNRRLPTVAEWEYAAGAGISTPIGREEPGHLERVLEAATSRSTPDRTVATGSANYFGVHDLHGLVWEWTADFNSALVSGESRGDSGLDRKLFCGAGVIGASDFKDYAAFLRFSYRGGLSSAYVGSGLGFRTAKSATTL